MASRTVGAHVVLDGEKEYKQALSELNAGNRTLATEMTKLKAEFKGQEGSIEALTAKGDLLQRQLQQQKDKVATLREAVKYAANEYGESSKATQKWMQELNLAEAAEINLQHALEGNNEALAQAEAAAEEAAQAQHDLEVSAESASQTLEDETEKMSGMGDVVSDLTSKLGIQLPNGARNALNGMSSLSSGTVAAMGAAAAGVALLIKGVKELQQETIEAAARADEIMTQATRMNISMSQYQQLQYASPFVDVDVDTLASSLSKLTQAMASAQAGGQAAKDTFRELGVSITNADGSLRDAYDVWLDTMDALSNIQNVTEQDAAAMELLGKSASELAPIYRDGTDALREYSEEAENNYVMSDEQLERLGEVDDAWQKLQLDIESNKNMIGAEWAPTAKKALEAFDTLVNAAGKALIDSGLIEGFGELLQLCIDLITPISDLLSKADDTPGRLKPAQEAIHGIALMIAGAADAANWLLGLLQTLTVVGAFVKVGGQTGLQRMGNAAGFGYSSGNANNFQRQQMIHNGTWDQYSSYYGLNGSSGYELTASADSGNVWVGEIDRNIYGYNATGNDNWRGGLTWVGENGPEVVALPGGAQIYSAQESRSMGGDTFYITIDAKNVREFNDIVKLAQSARVRGRM